MLEDYNPYKYLRKAQTTKFRELTFPILIIFISFALSYVWESNLLIILSLVGLLGYINISIRYRIRQTIPEESGPNLILAPLNARISWIKANKIMLVKKWYYTCEFRTPTAFEIKYKLNCSKKIWFEQKNNLPGKLVGIVPMKATCELEIPSDFKVMVRKGEKIIAGETVIASQNY